MKKQIDVDYKLEIKVEKELNVQIVKDGKIDKLTDKQRAVLESYYCTSKYKIFAINKTYTSINDCKTDFLVKITAIENWLLLNNLILGEIDNYGGSLQTIGWTKLTDEELISKYISHYKAEQNKLAKDKAKKAKEKQKAAKSKINTKKDAEKLIKLLKEKFDI
jgi:hypothetical protein